MKSIFDLDRLRDSLATENSIKKFKDTYNTRVNFKNLNTSSFWDEKMHDEDSLPESPIYKDKTRTVIKILSKFNGKVLDIGLGGAILEHCLSESDKLVFSGIDISPYVIRKAKSELKGVFKVGNLQDIPFKDRSFDIVLALDVLEHIPSYETLDVYKEIIRVSKRKFKIIISVPLNENLEEMVKKGINPNAHMRVYTPNILKTELSLFGFKIIEENYLYAFDSFYFIKKILTKLLRGNIFKPNLLILLAEKV